MAIALLVYGILFIVGKNELEHREAQLSNARLAISISQIKPHFIFNILNSIYVLIRKDPDQARRAVEVFSDYLRMNLDSLEKEGVVDFSKEKEYVCHYLDLEKIRFQEKLSVRWDLETESFSLPALTVQPLVENAVRHGVMRKKDGGTVFEFGEAVEGMIEEALAEATARIHVRTGDLLAIELSAPLHLCSRPCNTRIEGRIADELPYDFNIIMNLL